jgi:hypothetical protein
MSGVGDDVRPVATGECRKFGQAGGPWCCCSGEAPWHYAEHVAADTEHIGPALETCWVCLMDRIACGVEVGVGFFAAGAGLGEAVGGAVVASGSQLVDTGGVEVGAGVAEGLADGGAAAGAGTPGGA